MTSNTIPYWHVDAFADRPFTGNPAAVMLLQSWLPDAVLQAIGEENNFAETAFLVADASGVADYELRWFTPTVEIGLCGHATLSSGHVLLAQDPGKHRISFRTRKAGVLEVRREAAGGYAVALPAIPTTQRPFAAAVAALGVPPRETWRADAVQNIFLYDRWQDVLALAPDMRGLAAEGEDSFICTASGQGHASGAAIISRVFVPGAGVDEDPVTGSAHAALVPFWVARLGLDRFAAYQASARGGHLACHLDKNRVWLGGDCVTVVEGQFFL